LNKLFSQNDEHANYYWPSPQKLIQFLS
jgi:hypothetical protein